MRTLVVLLLIGSSIAGGVYYVKFLRAEEPPNLRTAIVDRGDLLITISATGTLEPVELIDVGAQVVGRIRKLGDDPRAKSDPAFQGKHVDYGSPVEDGTVLAEIDDALYRATYSENVAGLERAKADLIQVKAKLVQATAEWDRAGRLRELKLTSISGIGVKSDRGDSPTTIKGISDSDYVLAKANFEVAKANVAVGEALVAQQQAALDSAET
jgi:HlyD family secretion protein